MLDFRTSINQNAAAYGRQHAIYRIVLNRMSKSYGQFSEATCSTNELSECHWSGKRNYFKSVRLTASTCPQHAELFSKIS